MDFSLSTSWNAWRLNSSRKIIKEIKALGFEAIEVSFNFSAEMVEELISIVTKNEATVVSVHNFCPVPPGVAREMGLPDYYSIASLDETQRKLAVRQTKYSIDTARRLKAKVLVLHCGRVEIPDRTKDLMALYNKGLKTSKEFKELSRSIIYERQKLSEPYFMQALKSLQELLSYAKECNISLGIENRVYYREIPSIAELKIIFDKFKNNSVFYWHDTGHAQLFEKLGFLKHKDYLDNFSKNMIGIHFHDIKGTSDHRAPLDGELDFNLFKPYIKKDTLKVLEVHHPATGESILKAKTYLEGLYN